MLVLSRKVGEKIQIGENVTVTLVEISGGRVKLGFDCPLSVPVHRQEVYERVLEEKAREYSLASC
jgi:carbon storage regulator